MIYKAPAPPRCGAPRGCWPCLTARPRLVGWEKLEPGFGNGGGEQRLAGSCDLALKAEVRGRCPRWRSCPEMWEVIGLGAVCWSSHLTLLLRYPVAATQLWGWLQVKGMSATSILIHICFHFIQLKRFRVVPRMWQNSVVAKPTCEELLCHRAVPFVKGELGGGSDDLRGNLRSAHAIPRNF